MPRGNKSRKELTSNLDELQVEELIVYELDGENVHNIHQTIHSYSARKKVKLRTFHYKDKVYILRVE